MKKQVEVMDAPSVNMKDPMLGVLRKKLDQRIASGQTQNKGVLDKIEKEGKMLDDIIAPLGTDGVVSFKGNGKTNLILRNGEEETVFDLHPNAVVQAGERLGVPPTYLRDLAFGKEHWQKDLAARILNDHTEHTNRQRVLLRAVGNQVRGVLSDQYRRLSTPDISASFLTAVREAGVRVMDAWADDTRMAIEVVQPSILPVPTEKNGTVYMALGARLSSSDFGDGALDLRAFWLQAICLNGAVAESLMRQVHLGGRIPDDVRLSERTFRLDTKTQASAVRDIVTQVFSKSEMIKRARMIQGASATVVDMDTEIKRLPKLGMGKGEVEAVRKVLVASKPEDGVAGEGTLWKLSQAIGAVSRDAEARRKRELDEIAGALLKDFSKN